MLTKLTKILKSQKGFTLIELMTVLIILGVILGIGVPRYLQVQAKAEWEADVSTIRNFAKAAETYAASINEYNQGVTIEQLITAGLIDGEIVLNRKNSGKSNTSAKNKGEEGEKDVATAHGSESFEFSPDSGRVVNLGEVVKNMIGRPPYGAAPVFPEDTKAVDWTK
jgi:prepilin-type N-terminal cleavage/methylation domain-containing protein